MERDPIKRFELLYNKIFDPNIPESSAMVLATASPEGKPSARVILLKGFDERGFVFYTNIESRNPYCTLCFYWEPIHYQVRVEGKAVQVSDTEADLYFATRPRGSQISAWASSQSRTLLGRQELETQFKKYEKLYEGKEIPRPPFWSGYRVVPERIEFWKRGENRLHERTLYIRHRSSWSVKLLYP